MSPAKEKFPEDTLSNILHSRLCFNNESCYIMGSDVARPLPVVTMGNNVSISLLFKNNDKIRVTYDALSLGGTILEPLENQFWGGLFGHLEDKHGIRWMVVGPQPGENGCSSDSVVANSPECKKARNE